MNRNLFSLLALVAGLLLCVSGCNSATEESASSSGTTLASTVAGDCCSSQVGCDKCAAAAIAERESADTCSDCHACAEGDEANCKCGHSAQEKTEVQSDVKTEVINESNAPQDSEEVLSFSEDRDIFHFLLSNNDEITRQVKALKNGVETLTESSNPEIATNIQTHVASMYQRVEEVRPIRMRDPLYREIFKHADEIKMKLEKTEKGIRVTETADDEYVVKLIQAHAQVVQPSKARFVAFDDHADQ